MSNFEFVDRRGQNKVEEVKPEPVEEKPVSSDNRKGWKGEIEYVLQVIKMDGQILMAGMAAAIRSDGNPFTSNYLFEQRWSEGFRWEPKARKRLETFLGCQCDSHKPCVQHKMLIQKWLQEDRERLARAAVQPVPEVIELLSRAQQAREAARPNLVVPRG